MRSKPAVSPFRQGADARYAGKPLTACPYTFGSPQAKDWRDGWNAIEKSMSNVESDGGEED